MVFLSRPKCIKFSICITKIFRFCLLFTQIQKFLWAIGTIPLGTDVQDYVDVGMTDFVLNENLEGILENNKTYYVTVQAINSAGLVSYKSSEGTLLIFLVK